VKAEFGPRSAPRDCGRVTHSTVVRLTTNCGQPDHYGPFFIGLYIGCLTETPSGGPGWAL
jgi:hypothetical protein